MQFGKKKPSFIALKEGSYLAEDYGCSVNPNTR